MENYKYKIWKKKNKQDLVELYIEYIRPNFEIDYKKFCVFVYQFS
jgi:hypothetical protein